MYSYFFERTQIIILKKKLVKKKNVFKQIQSLFLKQIYTGFILIIIPKAHIYYL